MKAALLRFPNNIYEYLLDLPGQDAQ